MSACICRQSASLTLENVRCAMSLNSVLTTCSRGPVSSPSGGAFLCQELRQVPAGHPGESKDWEADLQPPLPPGAFLQGKGCCYREEPCCQSCRNCGRSFLILLPHKGEEGPRCHWHPRWEHSHWYGCPACSFVTEAHFFWWLCQLR